MCGSCAPCALPRGRTQTTTPRRNWISVSLNDADASTKLNDLTKGILGRVYPAYINLLGERAKVVSEMNYSDIIRELKSRGVRLQGRRGRGRTKKVLVDLLEKSLTEEVKEFQEVNKTGSPQNEKEVRSNLAIVPRVGARKPRYYCGAYA